MAERLSEAVGPVAFPGLTDEWGSTVIGQAALSGPTLSEAVGTVAFPGLTDEWGSTIMGQVTLSVPTLTETLSEFIREDMSIFKSEAL